MNVVVRAVILPLLRAILNFTRLSVCLSVSVFYVKKNKNQWPLSIVNHHYKFTTIFSFQSHIRYEMIRKRKTTGTSVNMTRRAWIWMIAYISRMQYTLKVRKAIFLQCADVVVIISWKCCLSVRLASAMLTCTAKFVVSMWSKNEDLDVVTTKIDVRLRRLTSCNVNKCYPNPLSQSAAVVWYLSLITV